MEDLYFKLTILISIYTNAIASIFFILISLKLFSIKEKLSNYIIFLSTGTVLFQVLYTIYQYTQNSEIGSLFMFYNMINLFILTFLYIYRNDMKIKFYPYWSFAFLFLMGMEIRTYQTFGLGF
ncbi:MAG: hypothetical protein O3A48_01225 [Actinomycetota bacterium]|nr:hypothetical protein [Actinomycetota bacterium]MDA3013146.1 hypothetical protein [Actinomycetota bacterium]